MTDILLNAARSIEEYRSRCGRLRQAQDHLTDRRDHRAAGDGCLRRMVAVVARFFQSMDADVRVGDIVADCPVDRHVRSFISVA